MPLILIMLPISILLTRSEHNTRAFPFPGEAGRGSSGRAASWPPGGGSLSSLEPRQSVLPFLRMLRRHSRRNRRGAPKVGLPIELSSGVRKAVPHPTRTGRFEVVDHGGDIQRRMDADQPMDMIRFPAAFDQRAAPICQNLRECFLQGIENLRRQGLPSVFGHKDDM